MRMRWSSRLPRGTMDETSLSLVFSGPAVRSGQIDVRDLAPSLLALEEMIQAANKEINGPDSDRICVKAQASAEGSYELVLVLQSIAAEVSPLLNITVENLELSVSVGELVDLLFEVRDVTGIAVAGGGLWALLKFLKGRKPKKIEIKGDDAHVHIGDNYFITPGKTVRLSESPNVRKKARKAVDALSHEGIDQIGIRRKGHSDLEIAEMEMDYFDHIAVDEKLDETTHRMSLQIINLSFRENNKWLVASEEKKLKVSIEDAEFLNKISKNEIAFSKGDLFECMVRERRSRTRTSATSEYSIVKVISHKPAAKQMRLV